MARRGTTNGASEDSRQQAVTSFRHAVRALQAATGKAQRGVPPRIALPASCKAVQTLSGMFDMLCDDTICKIVAELLQLSRTPPGIAYLEAAAASRRSVVALMLSCRRTHDLINSAALPYKAELHARMATKIVAVQRESAWPFTDQLGQELVSFDQLRMLHASHQAMACHCARTCCLRVRRAFNRDVAKSRILARPCSPKPSASGAAFAGCIVSATDTAAMLAPTQDGTAAYVYRRRRLVNSGVCHTGRVRRYEDEILKLAIVGEASAATLSATTEARIAIDMSSTSAPVLMRASPSGNAVAWICSKHDIDSDPAADTPLSAAFLWFKDEVEACELHPADEWDAVWSAQDVWFTTVCGDADEPMDAVVVAWSTDFVHPSGHHLGSGCEEPSKRSYVFNVYSIQPDCEPVLYTTCLPQCSGILISCAPTHDGREVLALVKGTDAWGTGSRRAVLHDMVRDTASHVFDFLPGSSKGPLCASISPAGDCIASVHKTSDSFVLRVMVRAADDVSFTPVQKLDLSPWLALQASPEPLPELATDLVKACFALCFSACGRFVAVHDRHPLFGAHTSGHGLVVVDMALRMQQKQRLRAFPIFSTIDQAPRAFHWTRAGIWMMPPGTDDNGSIGARGGAICLYAPKTAGI